MKLYSKRDLLDLVGHQPKERLPYHDVRDDGVYLRDPTEFEIRVGLVDIPVEHPIGEPGKRALSFPFTQRQFLDFERTAGVVAEMGDEEVEALSRRNPQSYELAGAARDEAEREFWKSWITRELWTLIEAACLLAGRPPTSERNFDKQESTGGLPARTYRGLKDSTLNGTIKFVEVDGVLQRRRVTPRDAVGWAMSHGLEVPAPLAQLKAGYEDPLLADARLQVEARRAAGRYTLEEAEKAIAEHTGERVEAIRSHLEDDVRRGELPTYAPGSKLPIRYSGDGAPPVRDFHDEVYGSDLNKWLAEHAPRIPFRFVEEPSEPARGAVEPSTPQATAALVRSDAGTELPARTGPDWIPIAREVGRQWMLSEERREKRRPTVVAIAKYLEGELLERGILGRSGALDWETIKRQALAGITGRKRGENFKRQKGNPHRGRRSPKVKS